MNQIETTTPITWRRYFDLLRSDYQRQAQSVQILILVAMLAGMFIFAFDSVREIVAHDHIDLDTYVVASSILRHGGNPYDIDQGQRESDRLHSSHNMPMESPVGLALFYWPISNISLAMGGHLWSCINPLIYLLGVLILLKTYCRSAALFAMGIFISLIHSAFHLSQSLGQISPLIFLLMVATVVAAERSEWVWAALFAAIATALKAYPVALVAGLWWLNRRAFIWGMIFTVIGILGPALLVPHAVYIQSLQVVASMTHVVDPWAQNQSIAAMWYRLLTQGSFYIGIINSPKLAWLAYRVSTIIGFAVWLITSYRGGRRSGAGLLLGYTIVTSLLFSTHAWEHYLAPTLIPFFALVCCEKGFAKPTPRLLLATIIATIIIAYPFDYADEVVLAHGILTLLISAKMFGMLLLWLLCTIQINRLADATKHTA